GRKFLGEVGRHLAVHAACKFLCFLWIVYAVERKLLFPVALCLLATLALIPARIYVFGNFEWRQRPANRLARSRDFCRAQRCAMNLIATLQIRCTFANGGLAYNNC